MAAAISNHQHNTDASASTLTAAAAAVAASSSSFARHGLIMFDHLMFLNLFTSLGCPYLACFDCIWLRSFHELSTVDMDNHGRTFECATEMTIRRITDHHWSPFIDSWWEGSARSSLNPIPATPVPHVPSHLDKIYSNKIQNKRQDTYNYIYICTYNYTTYIIRHMVHRDCFCPWTRACEIELLSGNRLRKTSHYAATLYARICWNMLNIAGSMFLDLVWSSLSACWMGLLTAARYVRNSGFRCISASFRSPQRCNENLTHGTFAWGLRWSKTKTFEDHAYRYSAFLCPQSIYVGGAYPD